MTAGGVDGIHFRVCPAAKHEIKVAGRHVDLVALSERHVPLIVAWRNNPAIRSRFFNRRLLTGASEFLWFERYSADPTMFAFAIVLKNRRTIGSLAISKVDWGERTGEFGRFLIGDPLSRGQGYGRDAAELALRFAGSVGLRTVSLGVMPDNVAAVGLYRRLGFVETGTSPRSTSDGSTALQMRMTLALRAEAVLGSPKSDSVPS